MDFTISVPIGVFFGVLNDRKSMGKIEYRTYKKGQ